jgi:hypothetical protein
LDIYSETAVEITESGDQDNSRLKGVYWPGMGLFDAATPEQRRKRNQRKDRSVLEQMKSNSELIQPTERIFNTNIEHERSRDIYASPSIEGSPVSQASALCLGSRHRLIIFQDYKERISSEEKEICRCRG